MRIGSPKEIKNNENRIGLTPDSVKALINDKRNNLDLYMYLAYDERRNECHPFHFEAYNHSEGGIEFNYKINDLYDRVDLDYTEKFN